LKIQNIIVKNWTIIALVIIFLFAFYIRSINIVPDRILSFDPTFQYRFTRYFVEHGFFPAWDELTYYVGRKVTGDSVGLFMPYLTSLIYLILSKFGFSLLTTCSWVSALYGALITIPAYLLGKELSNKYGGLLSAALIAVAPQILVRTFGSSYDTDQLVLFFIVLTLYLGLYALRKKTITSICIVSIGFIAFMLTWGYFIYSFIILSIFALIYYFVKSVFSDDNKIKIEFKHSLGNLKTNIIILLSIFIIFTIAGFILDVNVISVISGLVGFVQQAEQYIVNISIAELQPFNVFNIEGWQLAMGKFMIGDALLDNFMFISFILLIISGLYLSLRSNKRNFSFLITLILIGFYTTFRGIRFTEFTSALFIIVIGSGFGYVIAYANKEKFLKILSIGLAISIIFISFGMGMQYARQLGPDINQNWDDAWNFIKTKTAKDAIIGTWWDPGHMIAALGERRNFADGAHCPVATPEGGCLYSINDRITDLGKIMATTDEQESLKLINKYKGDSSEVYWIASDDLIGKYQWLQYFGTGCDARKDPRCPLYYMIPQTTYALTPNGQIGIRYYQNVVLIEGDSPIPIFIQGKNGAIFSEMIYEYGDGTKQIIPLSEFNISNIIKPLENQLNVKISSSSIKLTIYVPIHRSYITIIPPNLRDTVFTKMFFLDGQGLNHFKEVYSNPQVKIFKVV